MNETACYFVLSAYFSCVCERWRPSFWCSTKSFTNQLWSYFSGLMSHPEVINSPSAIWSLQPFQTKGVTDVQRRNAGSVKTELAEWQRNVRKQKYSWMEAGHPLRYISKLSWIELQLWSVPAFFWLKSPVTCWLDSPAGSIHELQFVLLGPSPPSFSYYHLLDTWTYFTDVER